ncbi:YceI family protein [Streptomyces sp. DT2A-34]|uniref:YceI family protein n=1 Tax=Streptomyces sp. DT2A-34 TaxID=3051182 RepID=UPI00265B927A|nr:YceI family protein [Streptomyces sp. DT2A-34]MDO0911030.1 YceI family protein [Streptomyces sp. DT2A-34]
MQLDGQESVAVAVAAETGTWQLDPAASTVALRHKTFWGLVTVKGTFAAVTGNGEVRPDGSAVGTITLDAASLDIRSAKRDEHLRAADSFTARLAGADADALTLDAEFTVDRDQFGMDWNQLGMMRGLTAVAATLRFTRTAAA